MKVRKALLSLVSVLILTCGLHAQEGRNNSLEIRHFQIASLLVDGREVAEFDLRFLVNGREIEPKREGRKFFVPGEVYEASRQDSGLRFTGENFDFTLNYITLKGYLDSDKIKWDYTVRVDTIPREIKLNHVSQLTEKEKRSLGIHSYKDVCAVYSIAPSNLVVNSPQLIVDPVTTKQFRLCKTRGNYGSRGELK